MHVATVDGRLFRADFQQIVECCGDRLRGLLALASSIRTVARSFTNLVNMFLCHSPDSRHIKSLVLTIFPMHLLGVHHAKYQNIFCDCGILVFRTVSAVVN